MKSTHLPDCTCTCTHTHTCLHCARSLRCPYYCNRSHVCSTNCDRSCVFVHPRVGGCRKVRECWVALLVLRYLSTSVSFVRAVCRVRDRHNLLCSSPLLKKTGVRQVVLDKWFPLGMVGKGSGWKSPEPTEITNITHIYIYICIYI